MNIKLYVGDRYKDGDELNLYYFNDKTKKAEEIALGLEVKDGYVSFTLTHMSHYFLTKVQGVGAESGFPAAIWLVVLGLCLIGILVVLINRRRAA